MIFPKSEIIFSTGNYVIFLTITMKHGNELTLFTGGTLPSLFADAGEGASSPHTGPTVRARIGGTGAVLGFRGQNTIDIRLVH